MARRVSISGGATCVVLAVLAGFPGCSTDDLVGAGGECFRASECEPGLVCVQGRCSSDLSGIVSHVDAPSEEPPEGDASAGAAGAPSGDASGGAEASSGGGGGTGGDATGGTGGAGGGTTEAGTTGGTGGGGGSGGGSGGTGGTGGSPSDAAAD